MGSCTQACTYQWYLVQLAQCRKPLYSLTVKGDSSPKLARKHPWEDTKHRLRLAAGQGSHTQPSPLACFPHARPSPALSFNPWSNRDAMHMHWAAKVQMLGTTAVTAVTLPVPPAGHLRGAANRPCEAQGLIPQQQGGWGVKCPTPPLRSLPATWFTKIAHQSGCSSRVGWCLTPNLLRLVGIFWLTLKVLDWLWRFCSRPITAITPPKHSHGLRGLHLPSAATFIPAPAQGKVRWLSAPVKIHPPALTRFSHHFPRKAYPNTFIITIACLNLV